MHRQSRLAAVLPGAILAAALICAWPPLASAALATDPELATRARAFVKAYGYLRFFHPSDEAAAIDWTGFAAHAAARVVDRVDQTELAGALARVFGPIAPTAVFTHGEAGGDLEPAELRELIERATGQRTTSDRVVGWQHRGVGLADGSIYVSARTGRDNRIARGAGFSTATQSVQPDRLRGRRARLTFAARCEGESSRGQGWLRVDLPSGMGFFDNMSDRPVTSDEWRRYSIEGEVAEDAEAVFFGFMLTAGDRAWVDDMTLEVYEGDRWVPVSIVNGGFEDDPDTALGWSGPPPGGFRHVIDTTRPASGDRSLRIERLTATLTHLFEERPALGEMLDVEVSRGVRLRAPLALPDDLGAPESPDLIALREQLHRARKSEFDARRLEHRLGNVAILWSVLQHFYPYFDVVSTDWEAVLDRAVAKTLADGDRAAHLETLQWMVMELHDGHGSVADLRNPRQLAPLRLIEVEGRVFVDEVRGELTADIRRADEVVTVGGRPVAEVVRERERLSSGSPQWRRVRALGGLVLGPAGGAVELGLLRAGRRLEAVAPVGPWSPPRSPLEPVRELEPGIFYADLRVADWPTIERRLADLAAADGVVLDLRGYPKGNHAILQHLTDSAIQSAKWNVPKVIYPDRERLVGYDTSGRWRLPAAAPRLQGKIVFLTDARAISYAESVMAIVKHYRLAEIVGSPTAGTNGNVNPFELLGGFRVSWTGMRVVNHDDSQHHLVGVAPTHLVEPTVAGLLAGRDEVLEAGLEIAAGRR